MAVYAEVVYAELVYSEVVYAEVRMMAMHSMGLTHTCSFRSIHLNALFPTLSFFLLPFFFSFFLSFFESSSSFTAVVDSFT